MTSLIILYFIVLCSVCQVLLLRFYLKVAALLQAACNIFAFHICSHHIYFLLTVRTWIKVEGHWKARRSLWIASQTASVNMKTQILQSSMKTAPSLVSTVERRRVVKGLTMTLLRHLHFRHLYNSRQLGLGSPWLAERDKCLFVRLYLVLLCVKWRLSLCFSLATTVLNNSWTLLIVFSFLTQKILWREIRSFVFLIANFSHSHLQVMIVSNLILEAEKESKRERKWERERERARERERERERDRERERGRESEREHMWFALEIALYVMWLSTALSA